MTSGITDHVFQFAGLLTGNCEREFDSEISVAVEVGSGVIGENIRGFGAAVGCAAGTEASVGNASVGAPTGEAASADTAAGVASALQAVTSIQTTKVKYSTRCIAAKYSGRKLSSDECL
jgi:hypothetical protein